MNTAISLIFLARPNITGDKTMEKLFTKDNTEGYTQEQLDALNAEWAERSKELTPNTDEYHEAAKRFSDEVAGR